ncbi:sulfatase-like hydrolase/transferase [Catalinimonas niigatensis]|uniref:sulfatase-like hydrolase/transferase n=1 Tax=Catalinimonas niigatensis TaxID=1397264 RepID=UPI0026670BC5|nr:sulfatase-like hydrolase/transferase [Catalinimonas niigatensis]WPP49201.1 sulfatase-like hydrolase/transferase [Catalinimonas niigatensis]
MYTSSHSVCYLLIFFTLFFSCTSQDAAQESTPGEERIQPNIIFILTDDLGYGDLGVLFQNQRKDTGEPFHITPHLDTIASQGMMLTRHYVPAPVCAPSRASLMLGVHQGHAEVRNNQFDKALPDNHTLASVLKEAGYATGIIGKWGLQGLEGDSPASWEAYPTKRGFDHFLGYVRHVDGHNHYPAHEAPARPPVELYAGNEEISSQLSGVYTTDLFTAAAKKWITEKEQQNPDQPFFLYLAYDTPHAGLQVASSPYPEGGGLSGGVQWIGDSANYINTAEESIDDYIHPDYAGQDWPDQYKRFASMVRRIDNAVGDLVQLLKDLNIEKETLIVFTSDNGPHHESYGYGEYEPTFFESFGPLEGTKRDTWEGGIRVPTIVRWPGHVPAGASDDTPGQFHDWMPTFAELANVPAPANTDGVSLLPILSGNGNRDQGRVYVEYFHNGPTREYAEFDPVHRDELRGEMQVIYLDGYKGVGYNIQSAEDEFRIYDTREDSEELNNLAGSSEYFDELQQQMKDQVLRVRRPNSSAARPYDSIPVPALASVQNSAPGLQYRLFSAETPWTPNTASLQTEPVNSGTTDAFAVSVGNSEENIVEYSGFLAVPQTGKYTFSLQTNGGAVLRMHEATLIDADKLYASGSVVSSEILLEKGQHPIHLTYAKGQEGTPSLTLQWSGPGFGQKEIEAEALSHEEIE